MLAREGVRSAGRGLLLGMLVTWLASCALWSLGTPPKGPAPLPPCNGEFVYPDSAGHCVPKAGR